MKKLFFFTAALLFNIVVLAQVPTVPSAPSVPSSPYVDPARNESGIWWGISILSGISAHHSDGVLKTVYPVEGNIVLGWRAGDLLQIGIGSGVRYYFNNSGSRAWLNEKDEIEDYPFAFPVFADFRGAMIPSFSRVLVPYWNAEIGYAINDGFFVSPTIGLRCLLSDGERHHLFVGLGWLFQQTEIISNNFSGHESGWINACRLKVGYQF